MLEVHKLVEELGSGGLVLLPQEVSGRVLLLLLLLLFQELVEEGLDMLLQELGVEGEELFEFQLLLM